MLNFQRSSKVINPYFCILSSLVFLTAVSALIQSKSPAATSANAESSNVTASVTVANSCTMSGTIESNKAHTATVQSGSYTADIGETLVSVNCNDSNGYSVYAIGFTGDVDGTTTLVGANTNLTIPTGTSTSTATSNWAMKLSAVSGTSAPTILSDTNGSFASYHVVPSTATKVATLTSNTESSSSFKTTYAVAIGTSQPADTYSGQVKYTLVHPSNADADGVERNYVITFRTNNAESIVFNGVAYTDGQTLTVPVSDLGKVYHIYGNYGTRYAFSSWNITAGTLENPNYQNTAYTIAGNATITLTGQQVTTAIQNLPSSSCTTTAMPVYDNRDDSIYWIQRLPDGNCWMLDNLALDLTDSTIVNSLSTANTNLDQTSLTYFKNGGGTADDRYPTEPYANWTSGWGWSYSKPLINISNKNNTLRPSSTASYASSYEGAYGIGQNRIGVYYNYCAVSVGYFCFGDGAEPGPRNESNGNRYDNIYDVCPASWRMPAGNTSGEYFNLYNNSIVNDSIVAYRNILSASLSGEVQISNGVQERGVNGYLWTSTRYNYYSMYYVRIGQNDSSLVPIQGRNYAFSVRCILNS